MAVPHLSRGANASQHAEKYADSIVNHLYSVGLALNTARDTARADKNPDLADLDLAIEEIDTAIQKVQLMALAISHHRDG